MVETLRHTILLLTLSCLMAACGSSETEDPTAGGVMRFDTDVISRAALTTSATITDSPFLVYGDMINSERRPDNHLIIIHDATEVRYDTSAGQWTYDEPRYWFPDFQHSFVALHPADATGLKDPQYSNNQLKFTYTQPANYKEANDLLIATHRRDYTGGETDAVRFRFDHILSNLGIKVIYQNQIPGATPLKLTGITLKNIPIRATYAVAPASLSGSGSMTYDRTYDAGTNDGWVVADRGDLTISFPSEGEGVMMIPNDNEPHDIFSGSDALLLMPNEETSTELIISYTTYEANGTVSREQTGSAIIPNGWKAGMTYSLSLLIVNGGLEFSIEVAEWKANDPIVTTVPRK